jgi:hypothetical protein
VIVSVKDGAPATPSHCRDREVTCRNRGVPIGAPGTTPGLNCPRNTKALYQSSGGAAWAAKHIFAAYDCIILFLYLRVRVHTYRQYGCRPDYGRSKREFSHCPRVKLYQSLMTTPRFVPEWRAS